MAYRVGDVVNGHRLGDDNQWHPVESPGAQEAGAPTLGAPAEPSADREPPDGSALTTLESADPVPWYQRREVIAAAAILVVALVIGLFLRRGDEVATTASSVQQPSATVSAQPPPATATAPAVPAPPVSAAPGATRVPTTTRPAASSAPVPAPSPTASAVRTPAASAPAAPVVPAAGSLNTAVRDGAFEFTVSDVKCGQSQVGSEFLNKLAQGQYCVVAMTVANAGTSPQVFDGTHQRALDGQGRTVAADTEAAWYMEESKSFLEPVEPGKKVQGTIVFDIPKTSAITELRLHHNASSSGARVKVS